MAVLAEEVILLEEPGAEVPVMGADQVLLLIQQASSFLESPGKVDEPSSSLSSCSLPFF